MDFETINCLTDEELKEMYSDVLEDESILSGLCNCFAFGSTYCWRADGNYVCLTYRSCSSASNCYNYCMELCNGGVGGCWTGAQLAEYFCRRK